MRIAFDAKRLFHNHTGLGYYSRSLVQHMGLEYPEYELILMTPQLSSAEFPYFNSDRFKVISGNDKFLWRYSMMTKDINTLQPDIYHGLSNELPRGVGKLRGTKFIVTIHDLIFLRYPEFYGLFDRLIYKEKFKRACETADHIIAISEATKSDIIEFFGVDPKKISVVYQSCADIYYEAGITDLEREGYGLFVSSITPRKNLEIVIEAVRKMDSLNRPHIKVVGGGGSHKKKLIARIAKYGIQDHFEFLNQVGDLRLRDLYGRAAFSIYPSLYEGFGIPIVESLLCGTPTITSNYSSMPEAGVGVAELVDPNAVDEIIDKMSKMTDERSKLDDDRVQIVRERFNPENHVKGIIEVYNEVLKS